MHVETKSIGNFSFFQQKSSSWVKAKAQLTSNNTKSSEKKMAG